MELFMLDFAILGLLMERPRHGYELKRALGELGFWKVSFGSLYPALRRLEKRGAIEATGGTGRRKSYRITDSGRDIFSTLMSTDPDASETERAFQIRLAFLGHLPTDRSNTENQDRYRLALMEHAMATTESDIAWIDGLVATERRVASAN